MATGALLSALAVLVVGCGGGARLVPNDLMVFVAADLKAPRPNLTVTTGTRTIVTVAVQHMDADDAHNGGVSLIRSCVDYFRRDNVSNFLADTVTFTITLQTDPESRLAWTAIAEDLRDLVGGKTSLEDFLERCTRTESWSREGDEL